MDFEKQWGDADDQSDHSRSSNNSTKKHLTDKVEDHITKEDGEEKGIGVHIESNSYDADIRACEQDVQCGLSAECVSLSPNQPKQCWCVKVLERPDPKTGICPSPSQGHHHDKIKNGVLHHHHLEGILLAPDRNATSTRVTNETSSMLRLSTEGSASVVLWPQIILPVIASLFIVITVVVVSFIYRRRYMIKQYYVKRNVDSFVRTGDGIMLLDRMNNVNMNPTYFHTNIAISGRPNVPEVMSEHLKLMEVVGEGAFGQVFRGELYIPDSESLKQVAVKVLKDRANCEVHEEFEREAEIMASFDHDNILKLLGVVVHGTDGSPYMIFEYMDHGDLAELLRKNDPVLRSPNGKVLISNKADLVEVSVQIANGMSYLAAQRFVHRDLATRNCLVGVGLIVKIADFGMSRDIYTNDYYRVGCSRMLPVRWMSPEAIKYGRFTCESDIWAYGVVLWEIFSFAKQPYCGHTNEEVIHFLDQGIILQRPDDCPSTMYHVMLGCWKRDPKQRITFERLVKYLTDFRNILIKPLQTQQHQQHQQGYSDSGPNSDKSLTCLDIDTYVVGCPDKIDIVVDGHNHQNLYTSRDDMGYLCAKGAGHGHSNSSFKGDGLEDEARAYTVKDMHDVDSLNDESMHVTAKASQKFTNVQYSDILFEKSQLTMDSSSLSALSHTGDLFLVGSDQMIPSSSHADLEKQPTSNSLFFSKLKIIDKLVQNDISRIEDGSQTWFLGHGSESPLSLNYSKIMHENGEHSASDPEIFPRMPLTSKGNNSSVQHSHNIPGESHQTNNENVYLQSCTARENTMLPGIHSKTTNKRTGITERKINLEQIDEVVDS